MNGGFGAGFLTGAVVSVFLAGTVSLLAPLPPADPGDDAQVDLSTPAGSGFNVERQDTNPVLPRDEVAAIPEAQAPTVRPQVPGGTGAVLPQADRSVAPVAPVAVEGAELAGEKAVEIETGTDVAIVTPLADPAPRVTAPTSRPSLPEAQDNAQITRPAGRLPQIEAPTTEVATPSPDAGTAAGGGNGAGAADGTAQAAAGGETEGTNGVTPDDAGGAAAETSDLPAYIRNAATVELPEGLPLMSLVLIDAGVAGLDLSMLASIGFPVTFVVDPDVEGATERAAFYRRSGFEVLAMLPAGLTRETVAQAAEKVATVLPTAVGAIERPGESIQGDRALAAAVVQALKARGLALVVFRQGLNQAVAEALRAGLPAGAVWRELDAEDENSLTMKRYLDRAALKAGQDGAVIVAGRTLPETVTALFSWAQTTRARSVALAPVTAALAMPE